MASPPWRFLPPVGWLSVHPQITPPSNLQRLRGRAQGDIVGHGPRAIRAAKALIDVAETLPVEQVLLAESRAQSTRLCKPEQMEVIAARFAKRPPVFD
jgi:enoyl-CoA hydratase/carnithine racemase